MSILGYYLPFVELPKKVYIVNNQEIELPNYDNIHPYLSALLPIIIGLTIFLSSPSLTTIIIFAVSLIIMMLQIVRHAYHMMLVYKYTNNQN